MVLVVTGFFVYMLLCADKSYYIGHTNNIEKRICEHENGTYPCCYTKSRLPVKIVFIQGFETRHEAFVAERQIKKWSRAKKQALVKQDWNEVSFFARRKSKRV